MRPWQGVVREPARPTGFTNLRLVTLAALTISMGSTGAAAFAAEGSAARLPGSGGAIVGAAVSESPSRTDRFHAEPPSCPYQLGGDIPPATFCVYQGIAFGSGGEVCATDAVVIWSSAGSESGLRIGTSEQASVSNREVYVAFVADPELVLLAIVDAPQSNRAELVGYTIDGVDASQPLAGTVSLRPARVAASGPGDVLSMELRVPRRFRPGSCSFASYVGRFLGVMRPPIETDTYAADSFVAPRQ